MLMNNNNTNNNNNRKVAFGDVIIYEFPMILGDHPGTKKGLPLTIAWEYQSVDSYQIDMYEYMHRDVEPRVPMKKRILKHDYRREYLTSLNMYSSAEFFAVLMEVQTIRESRRFNAGVQDFHLLDEFLRHSGKALKWSSSLAANGVNMALHGLKNGTLYTVNTARDSTMKVAMLGVNCTKAVAKGTLDATTKFTVSRSLSRSRVGSLRRITITAEDTPIPTTPVDATAVDDTTSVATATATADTPEDRVLVKVGSSGRGIKKFIRLPADMVNSFHGVGVSVSPADAHQRRLLKRSASMDDDGDIISITTTLDHNAAPVVRRRSRTPLGLRGTPLRTRSASLDEMLNDNHRNNTTDDAPLGTVRCRRRRSRTPLGGGVCPAETENQSISPNHLDLDDDPDNNNDHEDKDMMPNVPVLRRCRSRTPLGLRRSTPLRRRSRTPQPHCDGSTATDVTSDTTEDTDTMSCNNHQDADDADHNHNNAGRGATTTTTTVRSRSKTGRSHSFSNILRSERGSVKRTLSAEGTSTFLQRMGRRLSFHGQ